jgi:hypothetical protein
LFGVTLLVKQIDDVKHESKPHSKITENQKIVKLVGVINAGLEKDVEVNGEGHFGCSDKNA